MIRSKPYKCYFISSADADTKQIRELLKREGIRPYEKRMGFSTKPDSVRDIIKESDFVIALVSLKGLPQNILFEIGVAYGLRKPIFLLIQGEGPIPSDLNNFVYIRSSANSDSIDFSLRQFLYKNNLESEKPTYYEGSPEVPRTIYKFRHGSKYSANGIPISETYDRELMAPGLNHLKADKLQLENRLAMERKLPPVLKKENPCEIEVVPFLIRLFEKKGAVVSQYSEHREKGADMALWIDSLANSFGNPILAEVKIGHLTNLRLKSAEQNLRRYLRAMNLQSGLLLYLDYDRKHFKRSVSDTPLIIRLDIRDLALELETKSLFSILLSERNAMVHSEE